MIKKTVEIDSKRYSALGQEDKKLVDFAKEASDSSHAPYSEFHVGCSVLHQNGHIGLGSNQENASFPSGLCAERVALFESAKDVNENKVIELAVFAKSTKYQVPKLLVPCAACLQVISDIQNRQQCNIKIWMWDGGKDVYVAKDAGQFLPFHFELLK